MWIKRSVRLQMDKIKKQVIFLKETTVKIWINKTRYEIWIKETIDEIWIKKDKRLDMQKMRQHERYG